MPITCDIRTDRLCLRRWTRDDLLPFAKLNADPRVMAYFPSTLSAWESDRLAEKIQGEFELSGFGLWAVQVPGVADFIGFVGLAVPKFDAAFTPCVEIGWRLAFDHWQSGYASEAAKHVLQHAVSPLALLEIVSFTVTHNMRSRRVMERIGMTHNSADNFDHPNLPAGHPLQRHVLYRFKAS